MVGQNFYGHGAKFVVSNFMFACFKFYIWLFQISYLFQKKDALNRIAKFVDKKELTSFRLSFWVNSCVMRWISNCFRFSSAIFAL